MIAIEILVCFLNADPNDIRGATAYWLTRDGGGWEHTVSEVGECYWGISVSETSQRVSEIASAYAISHRCVHCGAPLELKTRAHVSRLSSRNIFICGGCDARILAEAEAARQAAQKAASKISEEIYQREVIDTGAFDYSDIDAEDVTYALALYVGSEVDEFGEITTPQGIFFAPWSTGLSDALDRLKSIKMIQFSKRSRKDAFASHKTPGFFTFDRNKVAYRFSRSAISGSTKAIIAEIRSGIPGEMAGEWGWAAVKSLWWKIAHADSFKELERLLLQYGLHVEEGGKLQESLDYALQKFSIPKVRNLLWRVSRDTAAYAARTDIIRPRAINSIPGSLMRMCDRYLANAWELKPFLKKWDEEESLLTTTLFDSVLESGVAGFNALTGKMIEDHVIASQAESKPD